ncbi:hypothetical protein [Microbacterium natoriense]|uniref:hypothetical protein n=1 Tax=Microbacterium natoriense TaxID=284570 RepID=UPI0027D82FC1|nr:hypothetical protein [Microbacterium natoriense]
MTADVNWLLTSVAQGSAAMIAIVGGLLVSRYVGLHTEQEAAGRRVVELDARAKDAEQRIASAQDELAEFEADVVLHDTRVLEALLGGPISVDEALARAGLAREGFDQTIFAGRITVVAAELSKAVRSMRGLIGEADSYPRWATFWAEHLELPVADAFVWEWAYETTCTSIVTRRTEAADTYARQVLLPKLLERQQIMATVRPNADVIHHGRLREQLHTATADSAALRAEASLARETLDASRQPSAVSRQPSAVSRQPEGFSLALQVLSVLAITGVAFPVVVMAFEVTSLTWGMRATVVVAFFASVGLLLRFLFAYASFLRAGGRRRLPRTVLGLLWRERHDPGGA